MIETSMEKQGALRRELLWRLQATPDSLTLDLNKSRGQVIQIQLLPDVAFHQSPFRHA
jgi:hypothetical protein